MQRWLRILIIVIVFGALAYVFRVPLKERLAVLGAEFLPCRIPITYRIVSFDAKFGISKSDFLSALAEAEAVWEKPISKNLFASTPDGNVKVNLIYDYRQQASDKLKSLGISVADNRSSYDALKVRYNALKADYAQLEVTYNARVADFKAKQSAYQKEVEYWNVRGGAPREEYSRLESDRLALQAKAAEIKTLEARLSSSVEAINAVVVVLNRVAASLNLTVGEYNKIGGSLGEEFEEGLYTRSATGAQQIDIYEFTDRTKLVRVLAHELGHALGLSHVEDPKAIMYKVNQGQTLVLSSADLTQLNNRCRIK